MLPGTCGELRAQKRLFAVLACTAGLVVGCYKSHERPTTELVDAAVIDVGVPDAGVVDMAVVDAPPPLMCPPGAFELHGACVQFTQQQQLSTRNSRLAQQPGWVVALSNDGNTLALGDWGDTNCVGGVTNGSAPPLEMPSCNNAGAAYVFVRVGGMWQQEAYLKPEVVVPVEWFGYSLAISADGGTLIVGAQNERSASTGINSVPDTSGNIGVGAAFVFRFRRGVRFSARAWDAHARGLRQSVQSGRRSILRRVVGIERERRHARRWCKC